MGQAPLRKAGVLTAVIEGCTVGQTCPCLDGSGGGLGRPGLGSEHTQGCPRGPCARKGQALTLLPVHLPPGPSPPFWAPGWTTTRRTCQPPDVPSEAAGSLRATQHAWFRPGVPCPPSLDSAGGPGCTEAEPKVKKTEGRCMWVSGEGSVLAPHGGAPEAGVGLEERLDSEHQAGGRQSGRRLGDGSFLAAASAGDSGLCTHRSLSDRGAGGGLGRRTVGMAGQGCDAPGPATGPCLYRRPQMTLREG